MDVSEPYWLFFSGVLSLDDEPAGAAELPAEPLEDGALLLLEALPEAGWSVEEDDELELGAGAEELPELAPGCTVTLFDVLELGGVAGVALEDEDELGAPGRLVVVSLDVELELEPELAPRFASPGLSQP